MQVLKVILNYSLLLLLPVLTAVYCWWILISQPDVVVHRGIDILGCLMSHYLKKNVNKILES